MSRSTKKGPNVDPKLRQRVMRQKEAGDREPLKAWRRACVIVPEFVNHTFMIHQGKTFVKLFVTEEMVGHRLGEFAATRTFRGHSGRRAKAEAGAAAGAPAAAAAPARG
jgi:small subunit ribosomal protein S19